MDVLNCRDLVKPTAWSCHFQQALLSRISLVCLETHFGEVFFANGGIWNFPGFGAMVALDRCCGLAFQCLLDAVDGDKQDLEAKGNLRPVREDFLLLSLAATSGAGTGGLLPPTKSLSGHCLALFRLM